jgi:hypothetical protein
MSYQLLVQLGLAGALLFVGVCLGVRAQPRLESPVAFAMRIAAVALSAFLFAAYVAESVGCGFLLERGFRWIAVRAHWLVEMCVSLF